MNPVFLDRGSGMEHPRQPGPGYSSGENVCWSLSINKLINHLHEDRGPVSGGETTLGYKWDLTLRCPSTWCDEQKLHNKMSSLCNRKCLTIHWTINIEVFTPRSEVYCFRLNFNISKLGFCSPGLWARFSRFFGSGLRASSWKNCKGGTRVPLLNSGW